MTNDQLEAMVKEMQKQIDTLTDRVRTLEGKLDPRRGR